MALSVRVTARALAEIDQSLEWLAKRSRAGALRWHEQLMAAIDSLEDNPERCALAPESDWYPGKVRQLTFGKKRGMCRILFEIRGSNVYILRVRHGAQKLLEPGEM